MKRRTQSILIAIVAVLAGLLSACSGSGTSSSSGSHPSSPTSSLSPQQLNDQVNNPASKYQGFMMDPAQPRPSFTLIDEQGKSFAFGQRTAGHPTLLYFGYTHCPDVCPTTLADIRNALVALPAELQKRVDVVFVTTDVKRDTGAVLAKWLSNFSAENAATFIGLRGTQVQINAAQAAAHITLAEDAGETHSARVLLFGADDYAHVYYLESTNQSGQIAHDLPLVATS